MILSRTKNRPETYLKPSIPIWRQLPDMINVNVDGLCGFDCSFEVWLIGLRAAAFCSDGRPSSRIVLLQEYDDAGFTFTTNNCSRKCIQLSTNPHAAMLFYWPRLNRQVRVEGVVKQIQKEQAQAIWSERSLATRFVYKYKSNAQSSVIPDREHIEKRKREMEQAVASQAEDAAAKPEGWNGLLLRPSYFEFCQGHRDHMHDRICFSNEIPVSEPGDFIRPSDRPGWHMFRLAP